MTSARVALPATALKRNTVTVLGGARSENVRTSANVLKQYFLEKSQTERLFDFLSPKINTLFWFAPPSIVAPSNQLFVNQILSRKQLHYCKRVTRQSLLEYLLLLNFSGVI